MRRFGLIGRFNNPESKITEPVVGKSDLRVLEKNILQALVNHNDPDPQHYAQFDSNMRALRSLAQHPGPQSANAAKLYTNIIFDLMPSVQKIFPDVNPDSYWVAKQIPPPSLHHFKTISDLLIDERQAQFMDQQSKEERPQAPIPRL